MAVALLSMLSCISYAANHFRLEGCLMDSYIEGQPYYWHNIQHVDISYMCNIGGEWQEVNIDSIKVVNGKFSYCGKTDGLTALKIWCKKKSYPVVVYVEPDCTTNVILYADKPCHFEQHGTSVDNEQECFNKYIYERDSINNEILRYYNAIEKLSSISCIDTPKEAAMGLDILLDDLYKTRKKSLVKRNNDIISFVGEHPSFKISPALLYQVLENNKDSLNSIKVLSKELEYYNSDTPMMQLLKNKIKEIDLINICRSKPIGAKAPDFIATTITGKTFRLKDMRGEKYVLLYSDYFDDNEILIRHPYINVLKDMYTKYKAKDLEFVALSRDFKSHIWQQFKNQTGWKQIIDIGYDRNTLFEVRNILDKYPMGLFPSIVLINKEGVIIAKWAWRDFGKEMATFMENEFK